MANFKDKINSGTGFVLCDHEHNYFIYQEGSMEEFRQNVHNYLYFRESSYRLFIQYEDTYGAESVNGRCFMWSRDMAEPNNSVSWRCLDDGKEDLEGFRDPSFDHVEGAIFISDQFVYVYGDTWIEAVDLEEKHVVCDAYLCGRFVSEFSIPAETFDRLFGLKENFPKQYENVFGKTEDAKPVQEENDLINEAKRNIESCMNLLDTHECQLGTSYGCDKSGFDRY